MTWNIHGGVGTDGRFDIERITDVIRRHEPGRDRDPGGRFTAAGRGRAFAVRSVARGGRRAWHRRKVDHHRGWRLWSDAGQPLAAQGKRGARHQPRPTASRAAPSKRRCAPTPARSARSQRTSASTSPSAGFSAAAARYRQKAPTTTVMLGDFNDWFWPGSLRDAMRHEFPARTRTHLSVAASDLLARPGVLLAAAHAGAQLCRSRRAACLRPPAGDRGCGRCRMREGR